MPASTTQIDSRPGPPPWHAVWFFFYLCQLPVLLRFAIEEVVPFFAQHDLFSKIPKMPDAEQLGQSDLLSQYILTCVVGLNRLVLLAFGYLLPYLLLASFLLPAIALMCQLIPSLSSGLVRWRYRLQYVPAHATSDTRLTGVILELRKFLDEISPSIRPVFNLAAINDLSFVYMSGFRSTELAVFGGLIRLWSARPDDAKSLIMHELTHSRRGDPFLLGSAGAFDGLGRICGAFIAVVIVVCGVTVLLGCVSLALSFATLVSEGPIDALGHLGTALFSLFMAVLTLLGTAIVFAFVLFMGLLIGSWLSLIGAVWTEEFNADLQSRSVLVLTTSSGRKNAIQRIHHRLLGLISHPPTWLRRWMLSRRPEMAVTILTVAFPAVYFSLSIGWQILVATVNFADGSTPPDQSFVSVFAESIQAALSGRSLRFILAGMLSAIWPNFWNQWERFWGHPPQRDSNDPTSTRAHPVFRWLAILLILMGILGMALDPVRGLRSLTDFAM
jgi:hypothetical protein